MTTEAFYDTCWDDIINDLKTKPHMYQLWYKNRALDTVGHNKYYPVDCRYRSEIPKL